MYDSGYQYGQDGDWLGELLAVPVDPRYHEPVTVVQFDQQYEALWAGTESGMLYTLQCPLLTKYASWPAHPSAVLDLQLLSDCAVSISSSRVALSSHGGYTPAAANLTENDTWVSAVVEPGTGSGRLLLAGSSGHLYTHDLITNKVTVQAGGPVAADGLSLLRGPVGHRGAVAAATAAGRIIIIDSRTNWQSSSTTLAHVGGISALEVSGDMLATSGYNRRMGTVLDDNMVKVFDCRSVLRPLFTVPCACPGMLAWHPINSMTLLCASPSGMFVFADPSNPAAVEQYQVDTAGDGLRCMSLSPSGDAIAFGGAGGYCHLWSSSMTPRITARSRQLQRLTQPTRQSKKAVISESGSLSAAASPHTLLLDAARAAGATSTAAAAAAAASTRLLSDVPDMMVVTVGKPPRIIDEGLKKELKQVDSIGYIPNPHYSRSKTAGAARTAALPLQHKRITLKVDKAGSEARAAKQHRLAESGVLLPRRYRRLVIKAQSSMRFEEFDFTYYNKTKFAGLENDLPNCYCNALLQVLYFTPAFRAAILQHKPEPALEYCLTCELLFLFKMLLSAAGGLPCQALNLLRALRQNREAAALGLLEGTVAASGGGLGSSGGLGGLEGWGLGGPAGGKPFDVLGGLGLSGDAAGGGGGVKRYEWGSSAAWLAAKSGLPKRVVTLCRFLLDHLYKEAGGESAATADSSSSSSADTTPTAANEPSYAAAAAGATKAAAKAILNRQSSKPAKKGKKGKEVAAAGGDGKAGSNGGTEQKQQSLAKVIQELFGLCYRSDLTALSGPKKGSSKSRQLTTFQVDLTYPAILKDYGGSSSSLKTPVGAASGAGGGGSAASPGLSSVGSPGRVGGGAAAGLDSPLLTGSSPSAASPPVSPLPPSSPGLATPAAAAAVPGLSLGPGAVDKPSFGVLLAASLKSEGVTKAWFDEACGYIHVKQSRVPLELPKVMVINCAMTHPAQVALWQPMKSPAAAAAAASPSYRPAAHHTPLSSDAAAGIPSASPVKQQQQQQQQPEHPWLPWVIQVRSDPVTADVDVITADSVEELTDSTRGVCAAPVQATYALTAVICHIIDEAEAEQAAAAAAAKRSPGSIAAAAAGGAAGALALMSPSAAAAAAGPRTPGGSSSTPCIYQGHVVALIRVQPPYLDPDLVGGLHRFPSAVDKLISHGSGILPAAAAAAGSGAASTLSRRLSSSGSGAGMSRGLSGGVGANRSNSGTAAAGFGLPDNLDDVFAELSIAAASSMGTKAVAAAADAGDQPVSEQQQQDEDEGAARSDSEEQQQDDTAGSSEATDDAATAVGNQQEHYNAGSSSSSTAFQPPAAAASAYGDVTIGGAGQQWLVINDFSISSIPPTEVMNWYNGQKLPCLLFYTQLSELESASVLSPPDPPAPVDAQTFQQLCSAPPLQGASWRGRRNFSPLEFPREAPRPGFMVAIDAEFVAVTRPETSFEGGVEVQLKPSRLALARVSVLRGSGPHAGSAFIDDYVASVEPVVDYLTRWSGIRPGDLDPSTSSHYLVSLKTAYLKLHHLLDAGCVFIGHGLKQDFRMLNINVPPEQVRDTVELFSFRRQRKLSLRFLASYLLGLKIQTGAGAAGAAAAAAAAAATSKTGGNCGAAASPRTQGVMLAAAAAASGGPSGATAAAAMAKLGSVVASVTAAGPGGSQGHDSIEDAATALALYNMYCKLKSGGKLEDKLHEMYRWGKAYGWEPVVHVDGVPQPPVSAAAVGTAVGKAVGAAVPYL